MPILYKAHSVIPYINAARGNDLFKPLSKIDNCEILVANHTIVEVGRNLRTPAGCKIIDLGDATILPPLVNCHTHLQLSWLAGKTIWGKGFSRWLKSMVPQLLSEVAGPYESLLALTKAFESLENSGTVIVADIGGSIPGLLNPARHMADEKHIYLLQFCEWFGFCESDTEWPERCDQEAAALFEQCGNLSQAGHALYSTSGAILQRAYSWCQKNQQKFSFHLAESNEETELLVEGSGALAEYYRDVVLPPEWKAPGLEPAAYARNLGLLGPDTIAVHGVKLSGADLNLLANHGTSLCICCRSNRNLAVGLPDIRQAIASGILLCLGTDGLTSCEDLDLRNEVLYIKQAFDLPLNALWRMAVANGASAVGCVSPAIIKGSSAIFSIWEESLYDG